MIHHDGSAVAVLVMLLPAIGCRCNAIYDTIFLFQIFLFSPASLPAAAPVTNKELEAVGVDANARLETYAKITVAHLVLRVMVMQEAEVTGDCKQEVVVPRW